MFRGGSWTGSLLRPVIRSTRERQHARCLDGDGASISSHGHPPPFLAQSLCQQRPLKDTVSDHYLLQVTGPAPGIAVRLCVRGWREEPGLKSPRLVSLPGASAGTGPRVCLHIPIHLLFHPGRSVRHWKRKGRLVAMTATVFLPLNVASPSSLRRLRVPSS